jgi:hypothetical protein
MDRLDIVQSILDHRRGRNYLEIGVKKGKVFFKVKAKKKMAVDPVLKIKFKLKLKACFAYAYNCFNEYYEMTSDDFFARHAERLSRLKGLDVVFIDGLHTYLQSYQDVCNSLRFLRSEGVIVMHDCNPATMAQAAPAASREHAAAMNTSPPARNWSGDVWKTIVRLRAEHADLHVCVLDCDHGVGIISRGEPEGRLDLKEQDIIRMDYADLEKDRTRLLNIKDPHALMTVLGH